MSITYEELIEILQLMVSDELPVWQTFILTLWIFCQFIQKLLRPAVLSLRKTLLNLVTVRDLTKSSEISDQDAHAEALVHNVADEHRSIDLVQELTS